MISNTFPERLCSIGCTQRSVSSNSFRRGQDLIEQLEIFGIYCDEGYLTKRELRAVRMRVVYTALKRIVKQLAAGKTAKQRKLAVSVLARAVGLSVDLWSQDVGLSKVMHGWRMQFRRAFGNCLLSCDELVAAILKATTMGCRGCLQRR